MICERCGKEYPNNVEQCPFCSEEDRTENQALGEKDVGEEKDFSAKEKVAELKDNKESAEESVTSSEDNRESEKEDGALGKEDMLPSEEENASSEDAPKMNALKKKSYDFVMRYQKEGQNVVLKAVIVGMIMLILTIGVGTFIFVHHSIKQDSAARVSGLIAKGATAGVSKGNEDKDIGSNFYVSGVNESIPLRSAPSQKDYKEMGKLYTGTVVILLEKTKASFWQVKDVATEIVGYVSPTFLTSKEKKVISLSNKNLSDQLGFDSQDDKIYSLCYVINAGEGISFYSTKALKEGSEIATLTNGNTVGVTENNKGKVWRVYDYRCSQYGFVESKYLTSNFGDVLAAMNEEKAPEASEETAEDKKGPEYTDSWSESGLSVRDGPTKETGQQVERIDYGDVVQLIEKTNEDFWYVYIPHLDMYGYVRSTCLTPVDENDTEPYADSDKVDEIKSEN